MNTVNTIIDTLEHTRTSSNTYGHNRTHSNTLGTLYFLNGIFFSKDQSVSQKLSSWLIKTITKILPLEEVEEEEEV